MGGVESVCVTGKMTVSTEKGGGGVLLGANPSYVVDGVGVERWLPGVICALLRHFS